MSSPEYAKIIAEQVSNHYNVRDEYKHLSTDELRDVCKNDALPYVVCIFNLTGDLNVGMLMRTASLMGASEFITFGRRRYDRRSTVGVQNYLPIDRIGGFVDEYHPESGYDIPAFHKMLDEKNLMPIFVEQGGIPLDTIEWPDILPTDGRTPCLILGNESEGIPADAIRPNDVVVSITQRGVLRSMNVATAGAIVMHSLASHFS